MAKLFNRAKMTTSTTGTGTITLGSASNGFQSFADAGVANGDVVQYVIEEGSNFEIGTGTYTSSGTTLSRIPTESSNSDNAITLAGNATVSITAVAADMNRLQHNGSDKVTVSSTGASVTGNLAVTGTVDGVDIATRDGTLTSTTTTANAALPKAGGTMTGDIAMGDNVKAKFGASDDLQIYHNSNNSIIADTGTGNLSLQSSGNEVSMWDTANAQYMAQFKVGAEVNLRHNGSTKFSTTSTGIDVTGNVTVSGTVDGRDLQTDGTKLDGISSGADVSNDATITISAGNALSTGGSFTTNAGTNKTITINHADTSTQASVNNSGNTVIQDVTLDTYGHVTGLTSKALSIPAAANNATITISAGTDLTTGGNFTTNQSTNETITINHADTSTLSGTYGSTANGTKIDQITVDARGHVTAITTGATGTGSMTSFQLEDGDGTEVTISNGKEVKFVEGTGIDINWTDTSTGSDGDPYDMTFKLKTDMRHGSSTDVYVGNTHDYMFSDASHGLRFYTSGAEEMRLENDGDLHVDGNITAYSTTVSDERLKTDIERIDGALDKVCALSGYTFTYRHDGKASAGVVAQEVEKVLPSAVIEKELAFQGEAGQEYKIVQYDQLHGLLIEAIKELKAEVEVLKNGATD